VLEVNHWRDLAWAPLLCRNGPAVAAYTWRKAACDHAAPLENAVVWSDRCTGMTRPPMWRIDRTQEQRAREAVDALAALWLTGRGTTLSTP
jgi:hypothetical protein